MKSVRTSVCMGHQEALLLFTRVACMTCFMK
jgi:hypothetical protein